MEEKSNKERGQEVKTYFTNDLIMKWHLFVYKCKSIIARLS